MKNQREGRIQVAIRIRPLLNGEREVSSDDPNQQKKNNTINTLKEKFDTIIEPEDSQADVFHKTKIHNILLKTLDGF